MNRKECREYEEERKKLLLHMLAECHKQLRMDRRARDLCERDIERELLKIQAIRRELGE